MKTSIRMSEAAEAFIAYRNRLGYLDKMASHYIRSLARFADSSAPGAPLTGELIRAWAAERPSAAAYRASQVRRFAEWMIRQDPRARVPASLLADYPHAGHKAPYIYAPDEIAALMAASRRSTPHRKPPSLGHARVAVLGLLAATGMRPGEALRLDDADVDLDDGVIRVRDSKNLPMRLVPLHPTVVAALTRYRTSRRRDHPCPRDVAFFLSAAGRRLPLDTMLGYFESARRVAGVPFRRHWRTPRLMDFRHTFAVRHLLRHHAEGRDMHCAIADLAVYMGHALVDYTYWYLTGTPELLTLVGRRFERYVNGGRREGDR